MTPDEVIKNAVDKLTKTRQDAFRLGAYNTFKEAGATDEEAVGLVKLAGKDLTAILAALGIAGGSGAGMGAMTAGKGQRGRGAAGGTAGGVLGGAAGGLTGAVGGVGLGHAVGKDAIAKFLLALAAGTAGAAVGGGAGALGGGALGGRLARKKTAEFTKEAAFAVRKLASAAKGIMPLGEGALARNLPALAREGAFKNMQGLGGNSLPGRATKLLLRQAEGKLPGMSRSTLYPDVRTMSPVGTETLAPGRNAYLNSPFAAQEQLKQQPWLARGLNRGFGELGLSTQVGGWRRPVNRLRSLQGRLLARGGLGGTPLLPT